MGSDKKAKHTPGALRAARALRIKVHVLSVPLNKADAAWLESVEDYDAEIIERESGLADLLAAAEIAEQILGYWAHPVAREPRELLRAAIARAKGGAA